MKPRLHFDPESFDPENQSDIYVNAEITFYNNKIIRAVDLADFLCGVPSHANVWFEQSTMSGEDVHLTCWTVKAHWQGQTE